MGERGGGRCSEETSSRKALGCERKGGREERKGERGGWRERERVALSAVVKHSMMGLMREREREREREESM